MAISKKPVGPGLMHFASFGVMAGRGVHKPGPELCDEVAAGTPGCWQTRARCMCKGQLWHMNTTEGTPLAILTQKQNQQLRMRGQRICFWTRSDRLASLPTTIQKADSND